MHNLHDEYYEMQTWLIKYGSPNPKENNIAIFCAGYGVEWNNITEKFCSNDSWYLLSSFFNL